MATLADPLRPLSADTPLVMLLHGSKYSSENWVNLGTLKLLNSLGYRTVGPCNSHPATRCVFVLPSLMRLLLIFHSPDNIMIKAAIDLPGFGKTRNLPYLDNNMRAEFLKAAFEFISQGANVTAVGAVLVSPSMSG